jgi:acyl-CoA reductase-like NAD-dependent aldehyde dehydrogenase
MLDAKFYIGGHFFDSRRSENVYDKFTGEIVGTYPFADDDLISMAIAAANEAETPMESFPAHKRSDVLEKIATSLKEREAEIAKVICQEAGKPIKQATTEVKRAQQTFRFAAAAAKESDGSTVRLDATIGSESKYGFYMRVPLGVVAAISPFNFPLNLVAHKVAPAIAAGCPVILKPASYTPLTSYLLAEIISQTELPPGAFNLLFGSGSDVGMPLVQAENIRAITFTGSPEIGYEISRNAGIKRLILELGSNSAVVLDRSADLDFAVPRITMGGFAYSGQVCISVQRIFVTESLYDDFVQRLLIHVGSLSVGNPADETTDVGPMISENEAIRVESWVNEAVSSGAKILAGGTRNGAVYEPTVLTDVSPNMKVVNKEIFGPIVTVTPFKHFADAIDMVNDSAFGLQAGVFTKNIDNMNTAIHNLKVGGVIINDVPTYRADNMPYGGVKMSGLGREGIKFAIEELTDIRMVVIQR